MSSFKKLIKKRIAYDLQDAAGMFLFRTTIFDADTGQTDTIELFIDNVVPSIVIQDVMGEQTGEIAIHYDIANDGIKEERLAHLTCIYTSYKQNS